MVTKNASASLADLNELAATTGASIVPVPVTLNGKTKTFHFKKLGFLRSRHLSMAASKVVPNENGEGFSFVLDTAKLADRNLDMLCESLVDENGKPFATRAELAGLPPELGDLLLAEANKINAPTAEAVDAAEGNSEATGSADTSTI